jgi:hypothetical protein
MVATGDTHGDEAAHERSYSGFVRMMKWAAAICFVTAMFVILIIS